jgi:hypothetical protein
MSEKKKPGRKPPEGEKKQFLTTMDPGVIKSMKLAALEDDITASEALEIAAKEWLERRKSRAKKA